MLPNHIKYDSFGNISSQSNASITIRFGYTGREFDPETGLYFYRSRYYDPLVGRFISEDPISFVAGDTNLYRYVFNSPINAIDPMGEQVIWSPGMRFPTIIGPLTPMPVTFDECAQKCALESFGLGIAGGTLVGLGQPIISTSGKFAGSTPGTSLISKPLARIFPHSGRFWAPTWGNMAARTPVLGRAIGRWIPIFGGGILLTDLALNRACVYKCRQSSNKCSDTTIG